MDARAVLLAIGAAGAFTASGVLMKASHGLTRWLPTVGLIVLAMCGASLNALAVHRGGELGPAYLMVVGVETVLAFGLGVVLFGERTSPSRLFAIALILGGSVMLTATERSSDEAAPLEPTAEVVAATAG